MGNGFFSADTLTINLFVSFRYDATAELSRWQQWFNWASEMLAEATDDKVRLGRIVYVNNQSAGAPGADLYLESGNQAENRDYLKLGEPGFKMVIGNAHLDTPGKLVHELGHYAFNLGDEYWGPGPPATCIADPGGMNSCVMQLSANSIQTPPAPGVPRWPATTVTEFCIDGHPPPGQSHRSGLPRTWQEALRGKGCWDTIDTLPGAPYPGLAKPGGNEPDKPNTAVVPTPVPVVFVPADPGKRFVLVLDRSNSMRRDDAIDGVRYAGHTWVDLEAMLGNPLGVVSYSHVITTDLPTATLTPPADAAHTAVQSISPGGNTDITGALERGRTVIGGSGTGRALMLFSDGQHNQGDKPSDTTLIGDLHAAGIVVHAVSFGPTADQGEMQLIGAFPGSFRHVNQPADASHTELEINTALSQLATLVHSSQIAYARSELGLASVEEPTVPPQDEPGSPADLDLVASLSPERVAAADDFFDLEVFVEEGVTEVSFVANVRSADEMFLYVLDPGGTPLDPAPGGFAAGGGHAAYVVETPEAGTWTMRIRRLDVRGPERVPVVLFAFAANPILSVAVAGAGKLFEVGERVELHAKAHAPLSLTNVRIRIWPEDDPARVTEFVEDFAGTGDYRVELEPFDQPGTYDHVIEFVGDDDSIEAIRSPQEEDDPDIPPRRRPGPFVRTLRRQLAVGPLPTGRDDPDEGEDAGGGGTGFCGWLQRWVARICKALEALLRRLRQAAAERRAPR